VTTAQSEALRLKQLACRVRDADPHRRVFCSAGKGGHGYEFAPRLPEEEIAEFEQRHGIRLPDDYRGFIRYAGNGGAGPGYGVRPLGQPKGCKLRVAFSVESRADGEVGHPYSGCLLLCQHGCAYDDYLVVNGPRAGTVWATDDVGCRFAFGSFTDWYASWAERAFTLLARDRLLDGVKVGQPLAELVRLLGPVERTWGEDAKRGERYVSFRDLCATFRLGRGDKLAEVIRLPIT
jgi:hypothetical protein